MSIVKIQVPLTGGSVAVKVSCPDFPESLAGIIWRYNQDQTADKKAGVFRTGIPEVPLGSPDIIKDKFFLIEGAVLHQNDGMPSNYQVVVAISQAGVVLHQEVPKDGGSGRVSDRNAAFLYRFNIEAI